MQIRNITLDLSDQSKDVVITEISLLSYEHTRYFVFKLDKYQHHISFSGFFSHKHTRNKNVINKLLYTWRIPVNCKYDFDNMEQIGIIRCRDLYEFYQWINYNRETKKYEKI